MVVGARGRGRGWGETTRCFDNNLRRLMGMGIFEVSRGWICRNFVGWKKCFEWLYDLSVGCAFVCAPASDDARDARGDG